MNHRRRFIILVLIGLFGFIGLGPATVQAVADPTAPGPTPSATPSDPYAQPSTGPIDKCQWKTNGKCGYVDRSGVVNDPGAIITSDGCNHAPTIIVRGLCKAGSIVSAGGSVVVAGVEAGFNWIANEIGNAAYKIFNGLVHLEADTARWLAKELGNSVNSDLKPNFGFPWFGSLYNLAFGPSIISAFLCLMLAVIRAAKNQEIRGLIASPFRAILGIAAGFVAPATYQALVYTSDELRQWIASWVTLGGATKVSTNPFAPLQESLNPDVLFNSGIPLGGDAVIIFADIIGEFWVWIDYLMRDAGLYATLIVTALVVGLEAGGDRARAFVRKTAVVMLVLIFCPPVIELFLVIGNVFALHSATNVVQLIIGCGFILFAGYILPLLLKTIGAAEAYSSARRRVVSAAGAPVAGRLATGVKMLGRKTQRGASSASSRLRTAYSNQRSRRRATGNPTRPPRSYSQGGPNRRYARTRPPTASTSPVSAHLSRVQPQKAEVVRPPVQARPRSTAVIDSTSTRTVTPRIGPRALPGGSEG